MNGITDALGAVMRGADPAQIEQVTLSTTVVTNTIVEHKEQPVDLYVVAGPGRNIDDIFPVRLDISICSRNVLSSYAFVLGLKKRRVSSPIAPIPLIEPDRIPFSLQKAFRAFTISV